MKVDTHNHSTFSPDGSSTPSALIETAINHKADLLCFTEHLDNDYPEYDDLDFSPLITNEYFTTINELRHNTDKIQIVIGVEVGWTKENEQQNKRDLAKFPYEYVINSVHVVDGDDVYHPNFFNGREQVKSFELYIDAVYNSIFADYHYDTIGHFGYVSRYADFASNAMKYKDYASGIDRVLNAIIEKDKILEVNSSAGRSGSLTLPDESVIERYYALGGRQITFGSDSHATVNFNKNYDKVCDMLKRIGFTYWTVCISGKKETYNI